MQAFFYFSPLVSFVVMVMLPSSSRVFAFSLRRSWCNTILQNHHNHHYYVAEASTTTASSSSSLFSSLSSSKNEHDDNTITDTTTTTTLLDPASFATSSDDGETSLLIPYPKSLSPSSISEFKKCPQSFLLQYLWKLRQPTNPILTKGIMCHSALEKLFDLDPPDRTLENLQNLLRTVWSEVRTKEPYVTMFDSIEDERTWGMEGLRLLQNYGEMEDPRTIAQPYRREMWVRADLSVDPERGITASSLLDDDSSTVTRNKEKKDDTFLVRGIVDRLDIAPTTSSASSSSRALRIVDYKTGKAPHLKYSRRMNDKILRESMEQLKIYALLLRESEPDVRFLRLFYLKSPVRSDQAELLDYDLGESQSERDAQLQVIHQDLAQVWNDIHELVDTQDPLQFKPCTRSFCYCHKCRPRFVPGTLAEP